MSRCQKNERRTAKPAFGKMGGRATGNAAADKHDGANLGPISPTERSATFPRKFAQPTGPYSSGN